MARTAITPTELAAAGIATPAGTTIDATLVSAGAYFVPSHPADEYIVRVTNTHGTDHIVTIPAGDSPPALGAGQGALAKSVPATSGDVLLVPDPWKHLQQGSAAADAGTIHIDFVTDHAGKITVLHLPRS